MILNFLFVHLIAIDQSPLWIEPALEVSRDLNQIAPSESATLSSVEENFQQIVMAGAQTLYQIPAEDPFVPDPLNPPCWYAVSGERILPSSGTQSLQREDASWVRLKISDWSLGRGASLQVRSRGTEWVEYTDRDLKFWSGYTHFIDRPNIEFRVVGDELDYVDLSSVMWGNPDFIHPTVSPESSRTLCGPDNRTAFSDDRVGRLTRWDSVAWCTAWMTSAGVTLAAGHCFDYQGGVCPGSNTFPDGTNDLQAGSIVEWNVPASSPSGSTNPGPPEDQYPINFSNLNFSHTCGGFGDDWAVFHLNPNAINGDNPHISHNWHRMTRETPPANDTIRITGFGSDNTPAGTTGNRNAQTNTSQTDTGPFVNELADGSGGFMHRYRADTTGGNSGSPVLWTNTSPQVTIGIHSQGGCNSSGSSANRGTSFENNALENAINNYWSSVAVFVDTGFPDLGVTADGTAFRPLSTVLETASTSTRLIVAEGFYDETGLIDTPCLIEALVGSVTIGE